MKFKQKFYKLLDKLEDKKFKEKWIKQINEADADLKKHLDETER